MREFTLTSWQSVETLVGESSEMMKKLIERYSDGLTSVLLFSYFQVANAVSEQQAPLIPNFPIPCGKPHTK